MGKPRNIQERAFDFAVRVVKLCTHLDGQPGVPRTLSNQLLRSGTSMGANLEEGIAAQSEADCLTKVSIACQEARETRFWLKLLAATEIVPPERLAGITDECNQRVAIFTATAKRLKECCYG